MEQSLEQNSLEAKNKRLTVEDLNIEILPIIYEIIRRLVSICQHARNVHYITKTFLRFSVERDHHDTTAKTRESQECAQKVLELQNRLEQARAQVSNLSCSCATLYLHVCFCLFGRFACCLASTTAKSSSLIIWKH